jgi:glycosyltransferase involved in cell wall biosynthesis
MHVAIVSVNEALLDNPLGDDRAVLRALGTNVDRLSAVVASRRARPPLELADNVTVHPVRVRSRFDGVLALRKRLVDLHAAAPIDIIQAQEAAYTGVAGLLARRVTHSKLSIGVFGADPDDAQFRTVSMGHRVAAPLMRAILRRADLVQTDSRVIERRLGERYERVRYKPMTPLTLAGFERVGGEREYRLEGTQLLYVGRLGRQKNLPLLLAAFRHASDLGPELGLRLRLVGLGPDETYVRGEVGRLGLSASVDLLGAVSHEELPRLYAEADALVLTSRYEGFPRVLLEAAAAALPVVSTPVAGALEMREQGAPVVVVEPDAAAIGRAIVDLARDRERRAELGAALRRVLRRRLEEPPPPEQQVTIWRELIA